MRRLTGNEGTLTVITPGIGSGGGFGGGLSGSVGSSGSGISSPPY